TQTHTHTHTHTHTYTHNEALSIATLDVHVFEVKHTHTHNTHNPANTHTHTHTHTHTGRVKHCLDFTPQTPNYTHNAPLKPKQLTPWSHDLPAIRRFLNKNRDIPQTSSVFTL